MKCEPGCTCKRHGNSGNFTGASNPCQPGCTCNRHQAARNAELGQEFGRWTVIETELWLEYPSDRRKAVKVRCTCGTERVLTLAALRRGKSESCGCLRQERLLAAVTLHGLTHHPLYGKWKSAMQRCYNPKWPQFKDWGGRGIAVCERWHDVATFVADIESALGPCPDGMSLDRINNDGDYEPGNVRWATALQQTHNRRCSTQREIP